MGRFRIPKACARARRSEIKSPTGIDAPYEPPMRPAIEVVRSIEQEIGEVVDLLIVALTEHGVPTKRQTGFERAP